MSTDNQKNRNTRRTVNVSRGGGPPLKMTPEAAAKYIQQATAAAGRELKINFGPKRPPSSNTLSTNNNVQTLDFADFSLSKAPPPKIRSGNSKIKNLDLHALKETAAATADSTKKGGKGKKDGPPCSEAEMKALMGMFVEIMGMSVDSKKVKPPSIKNDEKGGGKGPVFMFGNSNGIPMPPGGWSESSAESMAAATAGFFADGASTWEAIRRSYGGINSDDDDYDDDKSLPNLDDMREMFQASQRAAAQYNQTNNKNPPGISAADWSDLEQVAMDDDFEKEEKERRAAKKREKKQRKKAKQKEEAAQKAMEAAQKKREKSVLSWRSRVVSACQSNETAKLDALLQESPLRKNPNSEEEKVTRSFSFPHLEFLLPNSVAKNQAQLTWGLESRYKLADYVLSSDLPIAFQPLRNGRTALHTACFHGDVQFIKLLLERLTEYQDDDNLIPNLYLNMTCDDSGWSPLHYAAVSGSHEVLEILLEAGCDTSTITDDTHTWRESDGQGISPRELIQCIQKGNYEQTIETHGFALQEMTNTWFSNQFERRAFLKSLERVLKRLSDVEINGYSPPTSFQDIENEDDEEGAMGQTVLVSQEGGSQNDKRKKKKKKKQKQKKLAAQKASEVAGKATTQQIQSGDITSSSATQGQSPPEKDPLVVALLGMGFAEEQINAAVKACGGTNRATADDLLTWILGQDADGNMDNVSTTPDDPQQSPPSPRQEEIVEVTPDTVVSASPNRMEMEKIKQAEAASREKEEAARRLAAKREEKRRRNREWNNREQARQQEAAKAIMAQAMAVPLQQASPPPLYATYPLLQPTAPNGLQIGIPAAGFNPGVRATAPNLEYPAPPTMAEPMRVPPMQVVPAPIPMNHPPMAINHQTHYPAAVPQQPSPNMAAGSQLPTLSQNVYTGNPPPSSGVLASDPKRLPTQHQNSSGGSAYGLHSASSIGGDDDRTVSSYGSNRELSVSSQSFVPFAGMVPSTNTPAMNSAVSAILPPGFRPPIAATATVKPPHQATMQTDLNLTPPQPSMDTNVGQIRATAKAFVPTSFTPSLPPQAAQMNVAGSTMSPLSTPSSGSVMPPLSGTFVADSQGLSSQMGPSSVVPKASAFSPGLLSAGMSGASRMTSSMMDPNLSAQDKIPLGIPVPGDPTTPSGSSLTGGLVESSVTGMPLRFGMESPPRHSNNTSSLLSTAFTSGPSVDASSIWGGSTSSAPSSSFRGLQRFSLGGVGSDESHNRDDQSDMNLQIPGWGNGGAATNPPTSGQGSIW